MRVGGRVEVKVRVRVRVRVRGRGTGTLILTLPLPRPLTSGLTQRSSEAVSLRELESSST